MRFNSAFKRLIEGYKSVPLQAWSGPEGSRKLRFPDYMTTAQDGGKVVSLTHRPPLPSGNSPGTHFFAPLSKMKILFFAGLITLYASLTVAEVRIIPPVFVPLRLSL